MSFDSFQLQAQYPPVDSDLVDNIVNKLKSQGIFDEFRKECLADVDTKPAYQHLQQRVNGSVSVFLKSNRWKQGLNKTQLRESLRHHVQKGFLQAGVDRIVDQVVNSKVYSVFMPKVEDIVYETLGIEKPKRTERAKPIGTSLAPKMLSPVVTPKKVENVQPTTPEKLVEVPKEPKPELPKPLELSKLESPKQAELPKQEPLKQEEPMETPETPKQTETPKPAEPLKLEESPKLTESKTQPELLPKDLDPVSPGSVADEDRDDSNTIDETPFLLASLKQKDAGAPQASEASNVSKLSGMSDLSSHGTVHEISSTTNNSLAQKSPTKPNVLPKLDNFSNLSEKLKQFDPLTKASASEHKSDVRAFSEDDTSSASVVPVESESNGFNRDDSTAELERQLLSEDSKSSMSDFKKYKALKADVKSKSEDSENKNNTVKQEDDSSVNDSNIDKKYKSDKKSEDKMKSDRRESSSKDKEKDSRSRKDSSRSSHHSSRSHSSKHKSSRKDEKSSSKDEKSSSSKDEKSSSKDKSNSDKHKPRDDKHRSERKSESDKKDDKDDKKDSDKSKSSRDSKRDDKKDDKHKSTSRHKSLDKKSDRKEDDKKKDDKKKKDDDKKREKKDDKKEEDKKKERESRKRKGERCSEVKPKEPRRSSDRDNSGPGHSSKKSSSHSIHKSSSEKSSSSKNKEHHQTKDEPQDTEEGLSEVDLILMKINSSIEEELAMVPTKKTKFAKNLHEAKKIDSARSQQRHKSLKQNEAVLDKVEHMMDLVNEEEEKITGQDEIEENNLTENQNWTEPMETDPEVQVKEEDKFEVKQEKDMQVSEQKIESIESQDSTQIGANEVKKEIDHDENIELIKNEDNHPDDQSQDRVNVKNEISNDIPKVEIDAKSSEESSSLDGKMDESLDIAKVKDEVNVELGQEDNVSIKEEESENIVEEDEQLDQVSEPSIPERTKTDQVERSGPSEHVEKIEDEFIGFNPQCVKIAQQQLELLNKLMSQLLSSAICVSSDEEVDNNLNSLPTSRTRKRKNCEPTLQKSAKKGNNGSFSLEYSDDSDGNKNDNVKIETPQYLSENENSFDDSPKPLSNSLTEAMLNNLLKETNIVVQEDSSSKPVKALRNLRTPKTQTDKKSTPEAKTKTPAHSEKRPTRPSARSSAQRYDSADLYKPRLVASQSSRRSRTLNDSVKKNKIEDSPVERRRLR